MHTHTHTTSGRLADLRGRPFACRSQSNDHSLPVYYLRSCGSRGLSVGVVSIAKLPPSPTTTFPLPLSLYPVPVLPVDVETRHVLDNDARLSLPTSDVHRGRRSSIRGPLVGNNLAQNVKGGRYGLQAAKNWMAAVGRRATLIFFCIVRLLCNGFGGRLGGVTCRGGAAVGDWQVCGTNTLARTYLQNITKLFANIFVFVPNDIRS